MIVYVTTRKHADTLGIQLHYFPGRLADSVRLVPYEFLYALAELPTATYIFTDFDRLRSEDLDRAGIIADRLVAAGMPVLNHPRRTLFRFDLLRRLHSLGANDYNVHRLAEWRDVRRYPVFIRRERDHLGPRSELLGDKTELSLAVDRFRSVEGAEDLMIVEFANAPFSDGRYRKFGLQRIGDRYFHQHCYVTPDWLGKGIPAKLSDTDRREGRSVIRQNPNVEQLRQVFEIAGVEYGRMDYAMLNGRPQVFEINTNPTIISPPYARDKTINSQFFAEQHEAEMLPLANVSGSPIAMPPDLAKSGRKLSVDQAHARTLSLTLLRMKYVSARKRISRLIKR